MPKSNKTKKTEAQPEIAKNMDKLANLLNLEKKQEKPKASEKQVKEIKIIKKEEKPKSRLESDLGEEEIDTRQMLDLLNPRMRSSQKADLITDFGTPEFSQGLGAGFQGAGKKEEIKYDTIKSLSDDYKDLKKRADMNNPEQNFQFASPTEINMMTIGRGSARMGREAHTITPQELTQIPESIRNYDTLAASEGEKFQGEKTAFQQDLDKRYQTMKK